MAQTGYTPIQIYSSSTGGAAPAAGNLVNSTLGAELAINITDGKLFYKDNANAVQVIAWKTTPTTAGGTGLTSYTAGDLLYYATGTTLTKLGIGAAGNYLSSSGTAPQWSAPAALTKTDDTNVTLTLGGNASTALLNAASLTLGWTGQLAVSRGGTGLSSLTANRIPYGAGTSAFANSANFTYDGTNQTLTGGNYQIATAGNGLVGTATNGDLKIEPNGTGVVVVGNGNSAKQQRIRTQKHTFYTAKNITSTSVFLEVNFGSTVGAAIVDIVASGTAPGYDNNRYAVRFFCDKNSATTVTATAVTTQGTASMITAAASGTKVQFSITYFATLGRTQNNFIGAEVLCVGGETTETTVTATLV